MCIDAEGRAGFELRKYLNVKNPYNHEFRHSLWMKNYAKLTVCTVLDARFCGNKRIVQYWVKSLQNDVWKNLTTEFPMENGFPVRKFRILSIDVQKTHERRRMLWRIWNFYWRRLVPPRNVLLHTLKIFEVQKLAKNWKIDFLEVSRWQNKFKLIKKSRFWFYVDWLVDFRLERSPDVGISISNKFGWIHNSQKVQISWNTPPGFDTWRRTKRINPGCSSCETASFEWQ